MARQTGMYYIGRYGNVVGSTWKGIPYLRYQPDKINQSKATRQSCNYLAQASRIAAAFRRSFTELLPHPKNRQMQNCFNGALKKWLATKPFEQSLPSTLLPFVTGFEFNDASRLQDRMHVSMQLQQATPQQLNLQISTLIPKQDIAAPAYTKEVKLSIVVACYNTKQLMMTNVFKTGIHMLYDNNEVAARQIALPFTVLADNLIFAAAALQYTATKKGSTAIVNDLRWMPCGIVCGVVH